MRFKVPQNIDIEDKIIGPLTGKQFLWLIGGGIIVLVSYQFFDFSLFLMVAVIAGGLACAFAFLRPYGQSLIVFLSYFFIYSLKGKQYIWQKKKDRFFLEQTEQEKKALKKEKNIFPARKKFSYKEADRIAKTLDNPEDYLENLEGEKLSPRRK